MADVYEQNLPSKANLTVNDYLRVVGSDNASYKQLVSDVAKKIIENYTGSSLAGSSQSVKSAIDSLNSKRTKIFCNWDNSGSFTVNLGVPVIVLTHGGTDNKYGAILFVVRINASEIQVSGAIPDGMTITQTNGEITIAVSTSTFRGFYFLP